MLFWLFVALAALCIGYRRQIAARYDRWLEKAHREARYETFSIHLNPGVDADIIGFLEYIASPKVYICELVQFDIGKLSRSELVDSNPERTSCWHPASDLRCIELRFQRDCWSDVIDRLKDMGDSMADYIKRLVREDMEYRREHGLLRERAAA